MSDDTSTADPAPSADDEVGQPVGTDPDAPAFDLGEEPAGENGAYQVLARKYRPRNFDELIGQEALVRTLTNAIETGRVAHAFILTGVRGIGKTTTARIIARALNCVGPDGTGGPTASPCGQCEPCRAIAEDRHVDVIEMDAASRTGVGDIRELIDGVRYRPVSARFKVYIIDEVHMLSTAAFNALLKTLEEPPEHVKFIFATTEIRKVPVTVLSRCQRFDLRRLEAGRLAEHLGMVAEKEGGKLDEAALALLARAADGSVRDGLSLLDQTIAQSDPGAEIGVDQVRDMLGLANRGQVLDLFDLCMKGDAGGALDLSQSMYVAGADPVVVLQDLLDVTHWLTRLKIAPEAVTADAASSSERSRGEEMAGALGMAVLTRAWQMILKGLGEAQMAPQPQTALEMLLVRLCYAADLPSPADLIERIEKGGGTPSAPRGGAPAAGTGNGGSTAAGRPIDGPSGPPSDGPRASLAPQLTPSELPSPTTFQGVVELVAERKEAVLQSHLINECHLVRFEPGRIELRPTERAPANLANQLGSYLSEWTGSRWVVSVSGEGGEATLRDQAQAAEARRREEAAADPLVRSVLDAFPGAEIATVRDLKDEMAQDPPTTAAPDPGMTVPDTDLPDDALVEGYFLDDGYDETDEDDR